MSDLPAVPPRKLTAKQEAFVAAYLGEARFNATKAALLVGYGEASARQRGYELVNNSDIAARISDELKSRHLSAEGVLSELANIATADWRDFVEVLATDNEGRPLKVRMDLTNKVKSLELLGKAHGLFTDRIDLHALVAAVELVGVDPDDV